MTKRCRPTERQLCSGRCGPTRRSDDDNDQQPIVSTLLTFPCSSPRWGTAATLVASRITLVERADRMAAMQCGSVASFANSDVQIPKVGLRGGPAT